jgi:hypothetical protein
MMTFQLHLHQMVGCFLKNRLKRMWNKPFVASIRHFSHYFPRGDEEDHKKLGHSWWSLNFDLYCGPCVYEAD